MAKSALDALDILARTPICVIVSGERMPEISSRGQGLSDESRQKQICKVEPYRPGALN
jgi:hypothetical protein